MPKPISVRSGQTEFLKVNTARGQWRDMYQSLLAMRWPRFAAVLAAAYLVINLIFAGLYMSGGDSIEGMKPGSFLESFFFSVETLATVGYGHMYPANLYGHIITTLEIICGMFYLAVITGLIFVRFSRPAARVLFSNSIAIAPFNGQPTLMLRVANLRDRTLVEVEFRIMFMRDEPILEGEDFRHFYNLKLAFDRLAAFPAALTLRHTIDESSPLYDATPESLRAGRALFVVSLVGIETVIPATIQAQHDYTWRDVRFGERFVDIYTEVEHGKLTVDYGRLHETESVVSAAEATFSR